MKFRLVFSFAVICAVFAVLVFTFVPALTEARGIVPCGGCSVDLDPATGECPLDQEEPSCNLCHIFIIIGSFITFLLVPSPFNGGFPIVPILAAVFFALGGFYFFVAAGSSERVEKGKQILTAAVIGLLIVYGSWVFVGFVLDFLGVSEWTGLGTWWEIQCGDIPFLAINATPLTIFVGESTEILWEASGVFKCTASGDWSGGKSADCSPLCSEVVTPPMALGAYSYSLKCEGLAGVVSGAVSVDVINRPPTVDAGPDQSVTLADGASLDGDVTDDGFPVPPGAFTTLWTMTSGPVGGTVTFGDKFAIDTTATFTLEGDYVLRLTADDGGDKAFDEVKITVIPPPIAGIFADPVEGAVPLSVEFADASTGGPATAWAWDFGDGTTSALQDPGTHIYTAVGTYTVSLDVTGPGGSDTATATITVKEPPPVAGISASPLEGGSPLDVTFADASSGGPITTWAWDFDDGTTTSLQNPGIHTFSAVGTYDVTLTVTGPGGSDTATQTITVHAPPIAAIFATPTSGIAPLTVGFSDASGGGPATAWLWDFGDATTSTLQHPGGHTYTIPGTYTVTLTVTGPGGSSVATETITVDHPPPIAGISASPLIGIAPLTVAFSDASAGGPITTWAWDFGDGITSALKDPGDHIYAAVGAYTVTLTVTGPGGTNTATETINVGTMIGHWPFNDLDIARTIKDYGTGGNDGTFLGETFEDGPVFNMAQVPGKYGDGLDFNATDTWVQVSDSSRLKIRNQITISAWINLRELTGEADQNMILNKEGIPYEIAVHDNTGPDDGIHTCGPASDVIPTYNFAWYLGGVAGKPNHNCGWVDGGGPIPKNTWTHVALTYNGAAARTYINGSLAKEYTGLSGLIQDTGCALRIGARGGCAPGDPPTTNQGAMFDGMIDEVRLYDRALGAAEINVDLNSPYPVARPVASWSFENIMAATAFDTHHLVKGAEGGAGDFDALNDYVDVPHDPTLLGDDQLSYGAWFYVRSHAKAPHNQIMGKSVHGGGASRAQMGIWVNTAGTLQGRAETVSGRIDVIGPVVAPNVWHHAMLVFDGTSLKLYLDGALAASTTFAATTLVQNANQLRFGCDYDRCGFPEPPTNSGVDYLWDGRLDDIKLWNVALTPEEVEAIYDLAPPIAHWDFNGLHAARTVVDFGSGGNDGTFLGETWNDATINGATIAAGQYGQGLAFDGIDDYVSADSSAISITDFTATLWAKVNAFNAIGCCDALLEKVSTAGLNDFLIGFDATLDVFFVELEDDDIWEGGADPQKHVIGAATPYLGAWHHYAFSYDSGTQTIVVYVDGVPEATFSSVGALTSDPGRIMIGADIDTAFPVPTSDFMNATIDEVRIYDTALTPAQITVDRDSHYPVVRSAASWSFESISGSTAHDTHHLVKGNYGGSASFDSLNDLVEVANGNSFLPSSEITIAAWQKVDSTKAQSIIDWNSVHGGVPANDNRITIHSPWSDGKIYWDFGKCCFPGDGRLSTTFPPAEIGQWTHIAVTSSNSTNEMKIYINGVEIASKGITDTVNTAIASKPLYFGWHENVAGSFFDGAIDDIKIWDRALAPDQVMSEFTSGP